MENPEGQDWEVSALVAAAHELKSPLILIRQLTLQLAETGDPVKQAEIIQRIRLTTERSLRLVAGLSRQARLEDALFELSPIVVGHVVQEVVEEIRPLATAVGQEIKVKGRKPLVAVGHFDLLRTILLGLLDNSLMSAPDKVGKIEVGFRRAGSELELSVRDHGVWLEPSQFKGLFAQLGKYPAPLADRPLSSGLGLLIAAKFAEHMHGGLSVVRHRHGGMSFKVKLPLSRQLELF